MFVFHRPPQPFDKDIIVPGTLAIHADPDVVVFQEPGECQAGELTADAIRIHDLRFAVFRDRFVERIQAEGGIHRDRNSVCQDPP